MNCKYLAKFGPYSEMWALVRAFIHTPAISVVIARVIKQWQMIVHFYQTLTDPYEGSIVIIRTSRRHVKNDLKCLQQKRKMACQF